VHQAYMMTSPASFANCHNLEVPHFRFSQQSKVVVLLSKWLSPSKERAGEYSCYAKKQ